jgi:hypothetical protein
MGNREWETLGRCLKNDGEALKGRTAEVDTKHFYFWLRPTPKSFLLCKGTSLDGNLFARHLSMILVLPISCSIWYIPLSNIPVFAVGISREFIVGSKGDAPQCAIFLGNRGLKHHSLASTPLRCPSDKKVSLNHTPTSTPEI